jgi:fluoride ion exporter CrcB/FEX
MALLDNPTVVFGLIGGLGGLLRAMVGVRKAYLAKRKFVLNYFLITVIGAIIIGAIVGSIIGINRAVALFAGYAGTDLLEGLAKSFKLAPIRIG